MVSFLLYIHAATNFIVVKTLLNPPAITTSSILSYKPESSSDNCKCKLNSCFNQEHFSIA